MAAPALAGRAEELRQLSELLRGARDGRFGAVVLQGDAGIGKTSLVRTACAAAAAEGALVLSGTCLPLTAVSIPLLGLRSAVRGLAPEIRPAFLAADASTTAPATGVPVPVAVDDWLGRVTATGPVLLAVDDLHWADEQTLDALMYVLAGPPERALAVVLTVRSSDVGSEHPLRGWLADVRRLPDVEELRLGPLTRDATGDALATVMGAPPHSTLVDEVFTRSRGNPYFARLLVQGLDPSTPSLPAHLPEELSAAVVRPGSGLSREARWLLVTLAAGGRPVAGPTLARAADIAGVGDPGPVVREAVDARMLDVDVDGSLWFHHPLQAEVLEQDLLPEDRRALHAGFAALYASEAEDDPDAGLAETVSDHFALADDVASAYAWAVRAAALMASAGDDAGRLRLLRRAVDLRPRVPGAAEDLVDLVEEARRAARSVGDWEAELAATDRLGDLVDAAADPLRAATIAAWRVMVGFRLGLPENPADLDRALVLSADHPGSWQRVVVLCESSRRHLWGGDIDAGCAAAAEAFAMADAAPVVADAAEADEWARARAYAFGQQIMADTFAGACPGRADELWHRTVEAAGPVADGMTILHATFWDANCRSDYTREMAALIDRGRRVLEEVGAPHCYVAWLSAGVASSLWFLGDVEDTRARLRVALGADAGRAGNYIARLTAAVLAAWQGRQPEGDAHLARARELIPDADATPNFQMAATVATVLVHRGDPLGAADAAEAALRGPGVPPTWCEWLTPLAARSLADLVEDDVDAGRDPGPWRARLAALHAEFPHVVEDAGLGAEPYRRMLAALDTLYEAELARAGVLDDAPPRWCRAVDMLCDASLQFDAAYAAWRAGEALLRTGEGGERRRQAAAMVRRGHALAVRLGAVPVREAIEALARSARIPLTVVAEAAVPGDGVHLTAREREVLAHVVAGRTYAEIAGALFLSEKTVSSHISNLLHKTGTSNRVDLAAWATRRDRTL